MPLSPPKHRALSHTRNIHCCGYQREDGLWDIEAHLVDTKTYPFDNLHRGRIEAGQPVHEMWIRLTIDEDFLIHDAEVATDAAPFPTCLDIVDAFAALKGMRMGGGFVREVRQAFSGTRGCTHLVELLAPMATTAFQTLFPTREKRAAAAPSRQRPKVIDTCHALSADGEVVKRQWPEFYKGE